MSSMSGVYSRAYQQLHRRQRTYLCKRPKSHRWCLYALHPTLLAPLLHHVIKDRTIPFRALCYDLQKMSSNDFSTSIVTSPASISFTAAFNSFPICITSMQPSTSLRQFSVTPSPYAWGTVSGAIAPPHQKRPPLRVASCRFLSVRMKCRTTALSSADAMKLPDWPSVAGDLHGGKGSKNAVACWNAKKIELSAFRGLTSRWRDQRETTVSCAVFLVKRAIHEVKIV